MSAQDYISRSILEPLGLTRTTWNPTGFDGVATGYRYSAFGLWEKEAYLVGNNSGAVFGGLYSCAADLAIWARFMLQPWQGQNPAWASILAMESIRELQEVRELISADTCEKDVGYEDVADGRAYGYGLRIFGRANYNSVGHSGGIPGIGCHLRWIPRLGIGAIAFANRTYAPAWSLVRVALDEVGEVYLSAALSAEARHYLESIANKFLAYVWAKERKGEGNLFAENVFLDKTREEWFIEFADLVKSEGEIPRVTALRTPSALRVNIHLSSLKIVQLNLTPTKPALIQSIKVI
jgi:CubicO group peptidase (beta-lactamase class C family)